MSVRTIISLLVIYLSIKNVNSITLVPERATLTYFNKKYFPNASISVRRASRRGEYVFNIIAASIVPIANNVSVNVVLFEHSTKYNQYIRTFIEFHCRFCDMIHKDHLLGAVLRKQGVTKCPLPPGPIHWTNMTLTADFDFEFPFEKGKAEAQIKNESAKEIMATAEVVITVQSGKRKG